MMALEPALGIPDVTAASAVGSARAAGPDQAVKDFESLFMETLLQSSGLAQTLDTEGGPEGGVAGELLVRELARGLSEQLQLNFGRSLGVGGSAGSAGNYADAGEAGNAGGVGGAGGTGNAGGAGRAGDAGSAGGVADANHKVGRVP